MRDLMKKEFLYGLRNSKFLVIGITYFFFAFSIPLMVKVVLPSLLKSQFPGISEADIAQMIDISQMGSMTNYMSNLFEVGLIVFGFTLAGIMASEIKDNTLVLPICSGRRYESILFSKFIVFGLSFLVISILSIFTTFVYSGMIFGFNVGFSEILKSSLLDSLYIFFMLSLLLMYGTLLKKPIPTGLFTIGTLYLISIIGGLFKISHYLPSGLHNEASLFRKTLDMYTFIPVIVTVLLIFIIQFFTLYRLRHMEWNQR